MDWQPIHTLMSGYKLAMSLNKIYLVQLTFSSYEDFLNEESKV